MMRRWEAYNTEMQAIIAAGGARQDADGWWIDTMTGELIGPDPETERPRTDEELAQARPLAEALPELAETIRRGRGRPKSETPKRLLSLRLDSDVIEEYRRTGQGWQARMNDDLRKARGL
ncbi:BrnA antitoxin family protein [Ancylobacter sp. IITR112]|uniref:BrnA antitoxin family protein n=1 Tax=Ancylobacter sp. IITR112 TaxID=3138073 RepID=UPI00352AB5C3